METGDCYSMKHNQKRIKFRLMKYTSIDDAYYLRLCGSLDEVIMNGLSLENLDSLTKIDCMECDGKISATDQLKQ